MILVTQSDKILIATHVLRSFPPCSDQHLLLIDHSPFNRMLGSACIIALSGRLNEIRTSRLRPAHTLDAPRLVRRPVACQRPCLHECGHHAKGKRGNGQRSGQQRADEESAPDRTLCLKRRRKDIQDLRHGQEFLWQGRAVRVEVHCVGKGQVVESGGDRVELKKKISIK